MLPNPSECSGLYVRQQEGESIEQSLERLKKLIIEYEGADALLFSEIWINDELYRRYKNGETDTQ